MIQYMLLSRIKNCTIFKVDSAATALCAGQLLLHCALTARSCCDFMIYIDSTIIVLVSALKGSICTLLHAHPDL
jgi:hypothetical protein